MNRLQPSELCKSLTISLPLLFVAGVLAEKANCSASAEQKGHDLE